MCRSNSASMDCLRQIRIAGREATFETKVPEFCTGLTLGSHNFKRMTNSSETAHPLVQKALAGELPIANLIGFVVEEVVNGTAVGYLQAGPQHANPMGTLAGSVLCDLADAAMGMAFASTLAPDESLTTMTLNINFFRPVWESMLRAEARVINRGKNVGYMECEVIDEDGKRVAKASCTCFVLRGAARTGRASRTDAVRR